MPPVRRDDTAVNAPEFGQNETVGVALAPGVGLGLASAHARWALPGDDDAYADVIELPAVPRHVPHLQGTAATS